MVHSDLRSRSTSRCSTTTSRAITSIFSNTPCYCRTQLPPAARPRPPSSTASIAIPLSTMASTDVSGSGLLSPDSFSFIHSREVSDSSESYSSLELSEDISSDDEIVWSPSDNDSPSPVFIRSQGAFSPATFSDEDVVVLSRPRSVAERYQSLAAPGSVDALANTLSNLQVTPRKVKAKAKKSASVATSAEQAATSSKSTRRRKRKTTAAATATATATTAPSDPPAGAARKKKAKKVTLVSAKPQPVSSTQSDEDDSRSVVDDLSDAGVPSAYDEAVQYVSE